MASVWEQLKQLPQVNVLLVNLVADEQINQQILQGLVAQANQQQQVSNRAPSNGSVPTPIVPQSSFPEIVVRCLPMIENTFDSSLYWETALDDALKRAIALGKQQRIRM